jgi:hypothetical protein
MPQARPSPSKSLGHLLDGNTMSTGGGNQPQLAPVETAQITVLGG